jgi:uncharacterized protein (TIGR03437 family)
MQSHRFCAVMVALTLTLPLAAQSTTENLATFYPGGSAQSYNVCDHAGSPCSGSALASGTNWTVTYSSQSSVASLASFAAQATVSLAGDNSLGPFPSSFESAAQVGLKDTVTISAGGQTGAGTLNLVYQVSGSASGTAGATGDAQLYYLPVVNGAVQYGKQTIFAITNGTATVAIPFTFGTPQSFVINFYALADVLFWTSGSTASANYTVALQSLYVLNSAGGAVASPQITASSGFAYLSYESEAGLTGAVSATLPAGSSANAIQPGEWVSIYGTNLSSNTATWAGDFPTSLGGTSVTINGKAAYLSFVSPGQINLQAPDDPSTGSVFVIVTNTSGNPLNEYIISKVTLAPFAPSFLLLDSTHVAGIIPRSDGSGAYGGGTYDILGPTGNSLGYPTVAAKAGDAVELYGTGFGPTNPTVLAGKPYSGSAPATSQISLLINNISVAPSFSGLTSAGVFQINVTVPADLGTGDVSLQAGVGGAQTSSNVTLALH